MTQKKRFQELLGKQNLGTVDHLEKVELDPIKRLVKTPYARTNEMPENDELEDF